MLEEAFYTAGLSKPQLDFTDIYTTMQIKIKIRIHKSVMDRVLDFVRMIILLRMVTSITLSLSPS